MYDAEPSKLVDIEGECKYVMTIAVATIQNVQGHTEVIRNSEVDAAYRLDQTKLAETQFTYMQTTSLNERRKPRRIRLNDVEIDTTEEMKGHQFENKNKSSEKSSQYQEPNMGPIELETDLSQFVKRVMAELNFKGRFYHTNRTSVIQKNAWGAFHKGFLRDEHGRVITGRHEAREIIQARQFMASIPKLALEMVKIHMVFRRAGIQIQWFLPGFNNLSRLLKNFLAFNTKITKVKFQVKLKHCHMNY